MEAHTALGRAARQVVPDAIAGEHVRRAVVELDGKVDRYLALGIAQHLPNRWAKV